MGTGLPSDSFKNIVFVFALLLYVGVQEGYGQTSLSPGDIAIITVNADDDSEGNKTFDFVPLVDLEAGTKIKFTDAAYVEANSELDSNEGTLTYTVSSQISAGSVLTYSGLNEDGFVSSGSFNPATTGDNIIAFQGDRSNPTFLYGVGWARGSSWEYNGGTNTSDIPPSLSESANTILNLGTGDNYQYDENSGLEGTASTILSLIGAKNNWVEDDDEAFSAFSSNFSLLDPPTIAFSTSAVDSSEGRSTAVLTIKLVESSDSAVDVDVAFLTGSSTATNGNDFNSYSTQTVSFTDSDGDGTTKSVSINLTDDSEFEDSEKAVFQLQNISTGTIISPNVLTLTIEDNDAPNIVFNEINADPGGDANGDGTPDTGDDEFVEFVNNGNSAIDISGWKYYDSTTDRYTFPEGTVIPAGTAFVVFGDRADSEKSFGGARLFEAGSVALNNGGEMLRIDDSNGNTIVTVDYPDASNDQSLTRNPDINGDFEEHSSADTDDNSISSPGTKVNGDPFGSDHAIAFRGSEGWRMISSPVQGATFNDFFGDFWMQGVSGSDDPNGDLTLAGWSEGQVEFGEPSAMSNVMSPGKGYIVYVFEDDEFNTPGIQRGFPKIISSNKAENDNSVSVGVTANDVDGQNGIDGNEGWNLLGNPFGTDVSVDALFTALEEAVADNNNLNANIYVWDHDKSGGADYVELSQGDGERIAPFQAFWVRYTQDGIDSEISLNRSDLASNTGTEFYKNNSANPISFSLELHGEDDYYDTYTVEFTEEGSTELDRYDGYHLFSLDANSINLFSTLSNNRLQKNVLPRELDAKIEIPLSFDVNGRNDLTFRWNNLKNLPDEWEVMLVDKETGREINLRRTEEFEFSKLSSEGAQSKSSTKNQLLNKAKAKDGEPRFVLSVDPNTSESNGRDIPESVKLNPNYPNPFNPTTTIPYEITEEAEVKLTVWNMIGQKVATLVDGVVEAGTYEETWNATNMPSGIYIARFEVGNEVFTRKMTLIK